MNRFRVFAWRVIGLFSTRRRDDELHDEIQAHLALLSDEHIRRGMTPAAARAAARCEFGGVEQTKETYRDQRALPLIEIVTRDVLYAVRALRRTPVFTVVVMLTFAFGIGATTAVFTVVNAVLVRELPYPNAARVVQIHQTVSVKHSAGAISEDQLRSLRTHSRTLKHVAFWGPTGAILTSAGDPVRINGALVSAGFFEAFGVRAAKGQTFTVDDELRGAARVTILSHNLWTKRFGQDPDIVGRVVTLDDKSYRVVGVMPAGVAVPELSGLWETRTDGGASDTAPDFWWPVTLSPKIGQPTRGFTLRPAIALAVEGFSREQAIAEAASLIGPLPDGTRPLAANLINIRDEMTRGIRSALVLFQGAVVFVLLIVCANVANLFLARASHRRRELAIRLALGASRFRAASESMTECVLLALAGSVLGVALAFGVVAVVRALPPGLVPRTGEIGVDLSALAFALALSLMAGVMVGVFVTLRVLWTESGGGLHDRSATTMATRSRPSAMLVVAEIAAAMVLLASGGLLLGSFVRLISVDPGFETHDVLSLTVRPPAGRYPGNAQRQLFVRQLLDELSQVSGVEAVAATTTLPFGGPSAISEPTFIEGRRIDVGVSHSMVAPGYFRAIRSPVLVGREFSPDDRAGAPRVVVVGQSFASRFFGGASPIGQELRLMDGQPSRIVGVVPDPKRDARSIISGQLFPEIYFPFEQPPDERRPGPGRVAIMIRTTSTPVAFVASIRRAVAALDPAVPVSGVATVEQLLWDQAAKTRVNGVSAATFGATALLLAVVGLYGVMAYSVGSRTQEFGVRMALGADARRVIRQVLGHGTKLTAIGLVMGLAGTWATTRSLRGLLFGVTPNDPATLAAATALFLVVALVACYVPARRASRVDPMVALRHD